MSKLLKIKIIKFFNHLQVSILNCEIFLSHASRHDFFDVLRMYRQTCARPDHLPQKTDNWYPPGPKLPQWRFARHWQWATAAIHNLYMC